MRVGEHEVALGIEVAAFGKEVGFFESVGEETSGVGKPEVGKDTLHYVLVPIFSAKETLSSYGAEQKTSVPSSASMSTSASTRRSFPMKI